MKQILIMILICISTNLFSQEEQVSEQTEKRNSITIGILQGGGSLIGADMEFLLTDRFGFQIGLGVPLEKGPAMPDDFVQPPVMLMYSIGAYIPF